MEATLKQEKLVSDYWRKVVNTNCTVENFISSTESQSNEHKVACVHRLQPEYYERLLKSTNQNRSGIYCICLSLYHILLHKWHGQQRITIASGGIHDRDDEPNGELIFNTASVKGSQTVRQVILETSKALSGQRNYEQITRVQALSIITILFEEKYLVTKYGLFYDKVNFSKKSIHDVPYLLEIQEEETLTFSLNVREGYPSAGYQFFLNEYIAILEAFFKNPDQVISGLDLIGEAEKQLLGTMMSGDVREYSYPSVSQLFQQASTAAKEQVAVQFESVALTYEQLSDLSDKVAQMLLESHQVQAQDRIAVMMPHSEWTPVALLGVLKAGATFVSIDPQYPRSRIDYILSDSESKLLMTDSKLFFDLHDLDMPMMAVDIEAPGFEAENEVSLPEITGDQLAYILYTSGTTGKPKGVAVAHNSLHNYLCWSNEHYFGSAEKDVFGWFTSLSFDLSLTGILGTLCRGGKLHILSSLDPAAALQTIFSVDSGITATKLTPSHLSLLGGLEIDQPGGVQCLIVGGEKLEKKHINVATQFAEEVKIYNEYGPTEATIGCTVKEVVPGLPVTIGSPIANTSIHILNADDQQQPPGLEGEIAISGAGLSVGYWNNTEATEQAFITNAAGERLYKTGDLGRWLENGELAYLGRIDEQLKVNGHRIEPMEITRVMESHSAVKSAYIIPRMELGKALGLVCYYIGEIDQEELAALASKELPDYMVPDIFIEMKSFPLTANGKIDLAGLPSWKDQGTVKEYKAPGNEQEKLLAEIYAIVLEKDRVGIDENFFHLGGDSIKAIQMVSRISREFDIELEVKDVFEQPTVEQLSESIARQSFVKVHPVSPYEEQEYYRASSGQSRLWILDQFEEDQIAYNQNSASVIKGELNVAACKTAFEKLVRRHESLRTTFLVVNEQLMQKVNPYNEAIHGFVYVDLRDKEDKEDRVRALVDREASRSFDLTTGPLVRASLFQVYDDQYVIVISTHHVISDGWSWMVLRNELTALYYAEIEGKSDALEPLKIQFRDYAAYITQWTEGEDFLKARDYWKEKLEGPIPSLDLPTYQPRPPIQTFNGKAVEREISYKHAEQLKEIGQESQATLFMVLIALVNLLFHKNTGQTDIALGTDAASRQQKEFEKTIGFFLDSIVLRTRFDKQDSFRTLLQNVKEVILGAFENQHYPFDNLIDDLGVKRDLSRTPFFDVLIIMQVTEAHLISENRDLYDYDDIKTANFELPMTSSLVDLEFNFNEYDNALLFNVRYNTDLYTHDQIQQLMDSFMNLVEQICQDPTESVEQYTLLSMTEQASVLPLGEGLTVPRDQSSVLDLIREQVQANPANQALLVGASSLSYEEIDQQSNQLANYLISEKKVAAGDLVGIYLDDYDQLITSILGVLKTGAAFVPIDMELPSNRVTFMVEDAAIEVVISDIDDPMEHQHLAKHVVMPAMAIGKGSAEAPVVAISPEQTAYVMYTSGTTGNPKGIEISMAALTDYALSFAAYFDLGSEDLVIQQASVSFDTFIEEVFPILTAGGRLRIMYTDDRKNVELLMEEVKRYDNAILSVTPSFINEMKEYVTELSSLKALISGGEELKPAHYGSLWKAGNLYNSYGPTEPTVCVTYHQVTAAESGKVIGKPMDNHHVYVLSEELQLMPVGVQGEICIAGPGVAKGYFNNEELTRQRFVRNPYQLQTVLYRTGDIGQWDHDGNLLYIGRKDDQVKIQGYRIEPSEVTHYLSAFEGVRSAFVTDLSTQQGRKVLVAFYTSEEEMDSQQLNKMLRSDLPGYMIPVSFIRLDDLPTTVQGKIDKAVLAEQYNALYLNRELKLPATPTEEKVLAIWQEVMDMEQIGTDENFFEIGGHSLKATRVSGRIAKSFGVKANLNTIFQHTTIASLSQYIDSMQYMQQPPEKQQSDFSIEI